MYSSLKTVTNSGKKWWLMVNLRIPMIIIIIIHFTCNALFIQKNLRVPSPMMIIVGLKYDDEYQ